jgi:hypothetical protein
MPLFTMRYGKEALMKLAEKLSWLMGETAREFISML